MKRCVPHNITNMIKWIKSTYGLEKLALQHTPFIKHTAEGNTEGIVHFWLKRNIPTIRETFKIISFFFNISCQGKMIAKPQTIVQYSCCGCLGMFPVLLAVLVTGTRAWSWSQSAHRTWSIYGANEKSCYSTHCNLQGNTPLHALSH